MTERKTYMISAEQVKARNIRKYETVQSVGGYEWGFLTTPSTPRWYSQAKDILCDIIQLDPSSKDNPLLVLDRRKLSVQICSTDLIQISPEAIKNYINSSVSERLENGLAILLGKSKPTKRDRLDVLNSLEQEDRALDTYSKKGKSAQPEQDVYEQEYKDPEEREFWRGFDRTYGYTLLPKSKRPKTKPVKSKIPVL
jgi:hypothetical protein